MPVFTLEIVCTNLHSVLAAQEAGVQRIELCVDLSNGGVTPGIGLVLQSRKYFKNKLHVLIRPRAGNFFYTQFEFEEMKSDVNACKQAGVDGIVTGILLSDGAIDKNRCQELVQLARPMTVTFHRAFDKTPDPFQALEDIISLGCDRVLTSGQKTTALEGAGLIASLVSLAAGRISLMPGGGISEINIAQIQRLTQAHEFHGSFRSVQRNTTGSLKSKDDLKGLEDEMVIIDLKKILETQKLLDNLAG